jgi:hypothetical protein
MVRGVRHCRRNRKGAATDGIGTPSQALKDRQRLGVIAHWVVFATEKEASSALPDGQRMLLRALHVVQADFQLGIIEREPPPIVTGVLLAVGAD